MIGCTNQTIAFQDIFHSPEMETLWKGYIDKDTPNAKERVDSITEYRNQIVTLLQSIPDPEEQQWMISLWYLHLQSRWMLLNTQIGNQWETRTEDVFLLLRDTTLISSLLGVLEQFLERPVVARLREFLADSITASTMVAAPESGLPFTAGTINTNSFGNAEAEQYEARLHQLHQTVGILKNEVARLYAEREHLTEELGRSDIYDIIALVRGLENQSRQTQPVALTTETVTRDSSSPLPEHQALLDERSQLLKTTGASNIPDLLARIRHLQREKATLNGLLDSLCHELGGVPLSQIGGHIRQIRVERATAQAQVNECQAEREAIARLLGLPTTDNLVAQIENRVKQQEAQHQQHLQIASDWELLVKATGCTDISQILRLFHTNQKKVEKLAQQLVSHESDRRLLYKAFGTADPVVLRERFLTQVLASNSSAASSPSVTELSLDTSVKFSEMLSSLEETLKTLTGNAEK